MIVTVFVWSAISIYLVVNTYAFFTNRVSCIRWSSSQSAEQWTPHHMLGKVKMKEFALIKQQETQRIAEGRAVEIEKFAANLKKIFKGRVDNETARVEAVLKKDKEGEEEEKRISLKKKLRKKTKKE